MRFTNRYSNGKAFIMNCALQSTNGIKDAIERLAELAEYEDTDLTPEEFKESVDFTLELNKKIKKVLTDLKYYLDTNEENGVVYIPKFVIEKMVNEHLKIKV